MHSFGRIVIMVVVSLLAATFGLGGYTLDGLAFVGPMVVIFWSVPIIVLVSLFHLLDRSFGAYVRYPIALIGLIPLALVAYSYATVRYYQGDYPYTDALVVSGLAWSVAWLATSPKSSLPTNN